MAQEKEKKRPGLKQEAAAVLGIFLAVFLLLSFISESLGTSSNWCGSAGELIAKVVMGFTGWGAYLLAGLVFLLSFLFFSPRMALDRLPHVTLGLTGAVISFCSLLSALSIKNASLIEAGGFLGKTFFTMLNSVVGSGGTILVLTLIFLFSLMLSTQFSPYMVVVIGLKGVKGAGTWLWGKTRERSAARKAEGASRRSRRKKKEPKEPDTTIPPEAHEEVDYVAPVVKELKQANKEQSDAAFLTVPVARGDWKLPPLNILAENTQVTKKIDNKVYLKISQQLEQKLKNFGVSGKVVGISPGPVVTTYEYAPAPGIKISKIVGLADDIALGLKAKSVRVVGSVPGKAALGIEIPNADRQVVYIRDLISSEDFRKSDQKLSIALGLDVIGNIAIADLSKMPHLLIAGATGAGKSVAINTIIGSILFNATAEEVRFLMIDPKRIELSGYEGIPHLLHPVVVEPKMAARALQWAVREMERRYRLLEEAKVKSFDSYNAEVEEKLPYIVIIVDELADLMMVASKDVESSIARLAQMARAAGMHIILATQRPSVDVLTGLIKANFPTRISFKVSSKIDSRTIIDTAGAECLLGKGDMLYLPPGTSTLQRIHGAFISEKETAKLVDFLKEQGEAVYDDAVIEEVEKMAGSDDGGEETEYDEKYDEAVAIVTEAGQASISMVQRRLRIGYNRAARMIETMEKEGVVGPQDGAKPREVLVKNTY